MRADSIGVRAMRRGKTGGSGKLTEELRTLGTEALKSAVSHAAIESGRSMQEAMRLVLETGLFGHYYQLRSAVSTDVDPFTLPESAAVEDVISALACSVGLERDEYIRMVLIEHAFGLVHAQMMAGQPGCLKR